MHDDDDKLTQHSPTSFAARVAACLVACASLQRNVDRLIAASIVLF
jgi:hypothetical protein